MSIESISGWLGSSLAGGDASSSAVQQGPGTADDSVVAARVQERLALARGSLWTNITDWLPRLTSLWGSSSTDSLPPGRRPVGTLDNGTAAEGTHLTLDCLGISDTLPPETWLPSTLVDEIPDLTTLTLMGNSLSILPDSIGLLRNLTTLDLSANCLMTLPDAICGLSDLRVFYALKNSLSTLPEDFGRLTNLRELALSSNGLDAVPPPIFELSNLEVLFLNYNRLTELPAEFLRLGRLRKLGVGFNYLTVIPQWVAQLPLQSLFLKCNRIQYLPMELAAARGGGVDKCEVMCNSFLTLAASFAVAFRCGSGCESLLTTSPTYEEPAFYFEQRSRQPGHLGVTKRMESTFDEEDAGLAEQESLDTLRRFALDDELLIGPEEIRSTVMGPPRMTELCARALLGSPWLEADSVDDHPEVINDLVQQSAQCSVCTQPLAHEWLELFCQVPHKEQGSIPTASIVCSDKCLQRSLTFCEQLRAGHTGNRDAND